MFKGRKNQFHGLDEVEAEIVAKRRDGTVDVLRVGIRAVQLNSKHGRFHAESRNRIEFTIVSQQVKGLGTFEDRVGVGAVTGVPQSDRRGVVGVAQFGIVTAQDFNRALHLVNNAVRGKRWKMDIQFALQTRLQTKERRFQIISGYRAVYACDLPKDWRAFLGIAPENVGVDLPRHIKQGFQTGSRDLHDDLFDELLGPAQRGGGNEHVRHPEAGTGGQGGAQSNLGQLAGPELTRDIGENPDAVPFAVDVTGAMTHARQRLNRAFHVAMRGLGALADSADQRTGIAFVTVERVQITGKIHLGLPSAIHGWHHLTALGRRA